MIALTQFFETHIDAAFKEPLDSLDREFKEHLVFVFNQVIQNLRKTGWTKRTLERVGKLLFRLWKVLQAYKKKRKRYTLAGWIEKVASLGKELKASFGQ